MAREIQIKVINPVTHEIIEEIGYTCGRTEASNFLANYIYNIAKDGESHIDLAYDSKDLQEHRQWVEPYKK